MSQELLIEEFEAETIIEEAVQASGVKEKQYFLEGVCIQSNIKNKNGRVYPKELVRREVDKYIVEKIQKNRALGELNHPESGSINYERVSHKYVSLTESGDNWIGRAQVTTKTPMGGIVAGLMDCGVIVGTSSRARGSVKLFEGVKVVQGDFALITPGDIVSDPSAPDAYLTNLMEGKEWVWANGALIEKETEIKKLINRSVNNSGLSKNVMKDLFNHIMSKI